VLANKLASPTLYSTQIKGIAEDVYAADPAVIESAMADLQAVLDRDPACDKYTQALLHFKGYLAIQSHRVAHHLWVQGRPALAIMLQSRISEAFHVDIHPAARVGRGILLDHATGVVIGETAVIGDNVSMLHHVTLGGSGVGKGVRHPQIGHGCLLGAGVTVLGPVTLGAGAKVGAGSVVVTDLEPHSVAVGVPARVIKRTVSEPCDDMDQVGPRAGGRAAPGLVMPCPSWARRRGRLLARAAAACSRPAAAAHLPRALPSPNPPTRPPPRLAFCWTTSSDEMARLRAIRRRDPNPRPLHARGPRAGGAAAAHSLGWPPPLPPLLPLSGCLSASPPAAGCAHRSLYHRGS
jgi:serine O-acetyltransferase